MFHTREAREAAEMARRSRLGYYDDCENLAEGDYIVTRLILLIILGTGLARGEPMDDPGFGSGLEEPSLMPASPEFVLQTDQDEIAPGESTMVIATASQNLVARPLDFDPGMGGEPIPEPSTVSLFMIAGAIIAWKRRQK